MTHAPKSSQSLDMLAIEREAHRLRAQMIASLLRRTGKALNRVIVRVLHASSSTRVGSGTSAAH